MYEPQYHYTHTSTPVEFIQPTISETIAHKIANDIVGNKRCNLTRGEYYSSHICRARECLTLSKM